MEWRVNIERTCCTHVLETVFVFHWQTTDIERYYYLYYVLSDAIWMNILYSLRWYLSTAI